MAKRMFSDEVFSHPVLLSLDLGATVLWLGLVACTDAEGRVCACERWLKRRLFSGRKGVSRSSIVRWLSAFESAEMLRLYWRREGSGDVRYCQLTNFAEHQKLRCKPKSRRREEKGIEENRREKNNNSVGVVGVSDSRSAEEGKSAPAEPPPTAAEAELAAVYERLVGHTNGGYRLHVSHTRAWEWARRGMTLEDLDAWLEYERENGTRLARHYMATYNRPADIPELVEQQPKNALSDDDIRSIQDGLVR